MRYFSSFHIYNIYIIAYIVYTRARKPPFNPSFCKLRDCKIVLNIFTCKKNRGKVFFCEKKYLNIFVSV